MCVRFIFRRRRRRRRRRRNCVSFFSLTARKVPSGARIDRLVRRLSAQRLHSQQATAQRPRANYSAPLYHQLVPCLNRHYACAHGYNFFMPASPWLTVMQHPGLLRPSSDSRGSDSSRRPGGRGLRSRSSSSGGLGSGLGSRSSFPNSSAPSHRSSDSDSSSSAGSRAREHLAAAAQACLDKGAVLFKKDDALRTDGLRSNTW
jgi:hypothetical protein